MLYRLKVVFVDNEEIIFENTEKHGFSDDLELFELTTMDEIFVVPIKQIKYISCDSKIFKNKQFFYGKVEPPFVFILESLLYFDFSPF